VMRLTPDCLDNAKQSIQRSDMKIQQKLLIGAGAICGFAAIDCFPDLVGSGLRPARVNKASPRSRHLF